MDIKKSLQEAILKLKQKKIISASLDAEILLSETIGQPKEFLYTHPEYSLKKSEEKKFKDFIRRRTLGEPVSYILGRKEFFGLEFKVKKNTLIPRPETEILVEKVIEFIKISDFDFRISNFICDIGTGSGAIAIALAKNLPRAKIIATDISAAALKIARTNATKHKVKIKFIQSNLLEKIKKEKIDIIAANLPYLNKNKMTAAEKRGLKFEPPSALYAGQSGLALYQKLFQQITRLKCQPRIIFCEIGHDQLAKAKALALKYFSKAELSAKADYSGFDRLLIIKL